MHLSGCNLKTERLNDDESATVAQIRLSLEPLTPELARELGPELSKHCFDQHGKILEAMTRVQIRLRVKPQIVTSRMAEGVDEHAVLRLVRFKTITVVKRGEEEGTPVEKKAKKVKPQKEVLRLTLSGLVDVAEQTARDFLCDRFGDSLFFTFEDEDRDLPLEGDGAQDEESGLPLGEDVRAPKIDPAAGDVLPAAAPRLAKGNRETKH